MERRHNARFEVELKCRLQPENGLQVTECTTINMSRSGALIQVSSARSPVSVPRPGDAVSAELQLPGHPQSSPRYLSGKGTAIRTAKLGNGYAVAVHFEQIKFGAALAAATVSHRGGLMRIVVR
jgi:hypothetical protein